MCRSSDYPPYDDPSYTDGSFTSEDEWDRLAAEQDFLAFTGHDCAYCGAVLTPGVERVCDEQGGAPDGTWMCSEGDADDPVGFLTDDLMGGA